jgi:2-amino-4-hydroxy-6-hydroxymethyldihydropteridine diphosphokinase
MKNMVTAYIGIGSNLGNREQTLRQAVRFIDELDETRVTQESPLRETDPVGVEDQPKFLNGVLEVETALPARPLLDHLLRIEKKLGRSRTPDTPKWGPREVDLDLLLYGDSTIQEPGLVVPHPHMKERSFVMDPLSEINPQLARSLQGELES